MSDVKAMLDELMGKNRNAKLGSKKYKESASWRDDNICKYYCVGGWCPVRQLEGTKCEIGHCEAEHNEVARHAFQKAHISETRRHWHDFLGALEQLEHMLRLRRREAADRLDIIVNVPEPEPSPLRRDWEMEQLDRKIEELQEKAERLAEDGKVSSAQALSVQAQILKDSKLNGPVKSAVTFDKETLKRLFKNSEVCEICGGLQNQDKIKIEMHNQGKIHQAFLRLPTSLEEVNELMHKKEEEDTPPRRSRSRSRRARRRTRSGSSRSSERRKGSSRDRRRSKGRSRSRSQRRRRRSYSRSYSSDSR